MQPYERPRTGMLAGSVGSRMSAFPIPPSTESAAALTITNEGFVTQAPAPPTFARAYDLGPEAPPPAVVRTPAPVATSGTGAPPPSPAGTSGRITTVTNRATTAARPRGINGIWFDWNGRRWVSSGPAIGLTGDFISIGAYRNSPVYQHVGDSLTIYIPSTGTLVVPFKPRGR